ncbi:MAG: LuxR C-terminal-related transcriptional regulator [Oleiphilaceae bacterium]|nr:LuxR C-terminal-related transcriptional regulator [Oleiphilaceae bacterium]
MLLTTKFMRPASDPRAIVRDRLLSRLEDPPRRRLISLVAPAGYGKTTLVNQWCEVRARQGHTIAWLSLDASDDQPQRFWRYVLGALEAAGIATPQSQNKALSDPDESALEGLITALINQLSESHQTACLVLDDYHRIENPVIHRQISFLVDYLPPSLTLVLMSRSEPPLPLSRWRVNGRLSLLHAGDLAFNQSECARFFCDYMGLDLSESAIDQLWKRTEGWAAAMQLTALSRQGQQQDSPTRPVMGDRGDDQHISDYVLSEVLSQQRPPVRDFLLETSLCTRLTAPLCDFMLESEDSQGLLTELVRANLFIIPLDNSGQWYRYHDLFREALSHRLQQQSPQRYRQLQSRAIHWLLEQDRLQEAISQILSRRDWPWLEAVLEQHGNNLIHEGYHELVNQWLDALPPERPDRNPRLLMLRIWALFFSNKLRTIDPLVKQLETLLAQQPGEPRSEPEAHLALHSELDLIRSYMARTRSDLTSAQDLTRQVLQDIDHTNIPLKSVTYYGIGLDRYARGDLPGARTALQSAIDHGKREKKHSTVLSSGGLLAWILFYQGEMELALEIGSQVRQWVDSFHTDPSQPRLISCWLNSALAQIHREKNHLHQAEACLRPMLGHIRQGTEPGQHVVIQYARAHLAFSQGNPESAIEYLEDARQVLLRRRDAILFEPPCLEALQVRCLMAAGTLQEPRRWLEHLAALEFCNPLNREQRQLAIARIQLALGQPQQALALLPELRLSTERGGHRRHLLELLLIEAQAMEALGRPGDAEAVLQRALMLAEADQFLRLIAEEGPTVAAIYHRLSPSRLPALLRESLDGLLKNGEPDPQPPGSGQCPVEPHSHKTAPPMSPLREPLSQRERQVLQWIHEGHPNKVIAEQLQVAPTTIKAHIRNLYGKLDVSSRTAALARARQLGLLP